MARTTKSWIAWLSPGLMIVIGLVLFFIPAPPTSLIGIALIVVGGFLWLVDYFSGEPRDGKRQPETQVGSKGD